MEGGCGEAVRMGVVGREGELEVREGRSGRGDSIGGGERIDVGEIDLVGEM